MLGDGEGERVTLKVSRERREGGKAVGVGGRCWPHLAGQYCLQKVSSLFFL